MGFVVYWENTGAVHRYFRKEGSAKAAVTKHRNEVARLVLEYTRAGLTFGNRDRTLAYCTFRDYEGVLMGLSGEDLRMWRFCNTQIG